MEANWEEEGKGRMEFLFLEGRLGTRPEGAKFVVRKRRDTRQAL